MVLCIYCNNHEFTMVGSGVQVALVAHETLEFHNFREMHLKNYIMEPCLMSCDNLDI